MLDDVADGRLASAPGADGRDAGEARPVEPGRRRFRVLFGAVVLGALLLRAPTLTAALPYTTYNDEHFVVEAASTQIADGTWDPGWYWYPSLLISASSAAGVVVGAVTGGDLAEGARATLAAPNVAVQEPPEVILGGRIVVLVLSVATVAVIGLVGRELRGRRVGLVAAVLAAILPAFALRGTILVTDTPAVAFAAMSLAAALRLTTTPRAGRWCVAAGAAAGLAFASKYTAGATLLVPLVVVADRRGWGWPRRSRAALIVAASALVAAVLAMPALVVRPGAVVDDWGEQMEAYERFGSSSSLFLQSLRAKELGVVVPLVMLAGLVLLLRRRGTRRFTVAYLVSAAATLAVLVSSDYQPFRNTLTLMPFLVVAAAVALVDGVDAVVARAGVRGSWRRWATPVATALLVVVLAVSESVPYAVEQAALVDTRVTVRRWLEEETSPSDRVLVASELGFLPRELDLVDAEVVVRPQAEPADGSHFDYVVAGELQEQPLAWSLVTSGREEELAVGRMLTSCPAGLNHEEGGERCPASPSPRAWHENEPRIHVFGPRPGG